MLKPPILFGATVVAFASSAFAVCLNPFGCEPKTLEECRAAATKLPTEAGLRIAIKDCQEKFVHKPRREQEARERAQALRKFERDEQRFRAAIEGGEATLKDVIAALGSPPTCSTKIKKCSDVAGGLDASKTGCTMHYWNRECPAPTAEEVGSKTKPHQERERLSIDEALERVIAKREAMFPPIDMGNWFLLEVIGTDGLGVAYEIRPPRQTD